MSSARSKAIRHRNLPLLLMHAREATLARFRPILHGAQLTEQQWRVLRVLLERGAMEPREIVVVCGISSPSLTGILTRMEEMGLVERERVEHDQRRVLISPSAQGQALARRIAPRIESAYAEIEAKVGVDFMNKLYGELDELVRRLGDPGSA